MRVATLTQEVCQPIRHVNQSASGGSYVAIFTLRVTPDHEIPGVQFSNEVSQPQVDPWVVAAIRNGIKKFVRERYSEGRPLGRLRAALVEIHLHPIDSKNSAFTLAAYQAMKQAFAGNETLVEAEAEEPDET